MLKVLIADDEVNICMLIKKLVNWENYDMQIIDVVHNGLDAMAVIEEKKPDLVISDIRMPGFSGLDIVKKTRDLNMYTDFIIISGYKQFEYAHTAINLGVDNYLLKPIDKKELEAALAKVCEKNQKNIKASNIENELRQQSIDNKMQMRRHFLNTIMETTNLVGGNSHESFEFDAGFEDTSFISFFTKVDADKQSTDVAGIVNIIENILNKVLEEVGYEYINTRVNSGIITVINFRENEEDPTIHLAEKCFNRLKQEMDKFSDLHLTMGVGEIKDSISEVSYTIREAADAVKCRCRTGLDRIIFFRNLHYVKVDSSEFFAKNRLELENMVAAVDSKALIDRLLEQSMKIDGTAFYSPISYYEFFEQVVDIVAGELKVNQVSETIINSLLEKVQSDMDYYVNVEEIGHHIFDDIAEYFGTILEDRRDRTQRPIRIARKYIEENYSRQLSQEEVAEAIGMSSSYLSTMFKKELGINFSDYLNTCRIDAAKNLLKTTDEPLAVIAEMVGYSEQRYFSKVFQKNVGLKPSVYRKMYS